MIQGMVLDIPRQHRGLSSKAHFHVMDGLRGMAAMAVILYHAYRGGGFVPNGSLAVDLFFLLSGFVISYSYDARLRDGMSLKEFVARRLIRLYPMILVGATGGMILAFLHNAADKSTAYPVGFILSAGFASLLSLPYLLPNDISDRVFPFDVPLWSLFFEQFAGLVYAVLARRLSLVVLGAIVVTGVVGVALGGPLGGAGRSDFLLGFPRVTCGFFGGVLLFRLKEIGLLPRIDGNFVLLTLATLGIFAMPFEVGGLLYIPAFALIMIIIVSASDADVSSQSAALCSLLGSISYPLYTLHWLWLYVLAWVGTKSGLFGAYGYLTVVMIYLLTTPVVAYLAARFYETPVRKFLTLRLIPNRLAG